MNSFLVALNAIMPTFLLLAFGYFLRQHDLVTDSYLKVTNALSFKFFLPLLLFKNIYKTDIRHLLDRKMVFFALASLAVIFLALCLSVPRLVQEPRQRGVIIQGIFRSNYVIFGVSLVSNVFGEEQAAVASVLSAILVPLYNVLAVVSLAVYTSGEKIDFGKILKSIIQNPLIIASLLGVLFSFAGVRFPLFLEAFVQDLAKLATPLALIVLGGDFRFKRLRGNLKLALTAVSMKLLVIPLLFIPLAVMSGIRGANLLALSLTWETPVAVSSYIMAQQAGADGELAGQLVVLSSACCIPTVFLMVLILQSMGLL